MLSITCFRPRSSLGIKRFDFNDAHTLGLNFAHDFQPEDLFNLPEKTKTFSAHQPRGNFTNNYRINIREPIPDDWKIIYYCGNTLIVSYDVLHCFAGTYIHCKELEHISRDNQELKASGLIDYEYLETQPRYFLIEPIVENRVAIENWGKIKYTG